MARVVFIFSIKHLKILFLR